MKNLIFAVFVLLIATPAFAFELDIEGGDGLVLLVVGVLFLVAFIIGGLYSLMQMVDIANKPSRKPKKERRSNPERAPVDPATFYKEDRIL